MEGDVAPPSHKAAWRPTTCELSNHVGAGQGSIFESDALKRRDGTIALKDRSTELTVEGLASTVTKSALAGA
jgi:hypothetical protein